MKNSEKFKEELIAAREEFFKENPEKFCCHLPDELIGKRDELLKKYNLVDDYNKMLEELERVELENN